jgi:hypothetical protein
MGQFDQKAEILLERLRSMADGKTSVKLFTEFNHATLDAVKKQHSQISFNKYLFKILGLFFF